MDEQSKAKENTLNEEIINERLRTTLEPEHLEVTDTGGGCGASFKCVVVSQKFIGKSLLARQRLVFKALEEEMGSIHALEQKTYTPEQWEKIKLTASK